MSLVLTAQQQCQGMAATLGTQPVVALCSILDRMRVVISEGVLEKRTALLIQNFLEQVCTTLGRCSDILNRMWQDVRPHIDHLVKAHAHYGMMQLHSH